MDPISLTDCHKQLQSLEYSPILGNNKQSSRISQLPKPDFCRPRVNTFGENKSAAAAGRKLSLSQITTPRKRLFSESELSQTEIESCSKMSKKDELDLATVLASLKEEIGNSEKRIGDRFDTKLSEVTVQIAELNTRQDKEMQARKELESKVSSVKDQIEELSSKVEDNAAPTVEEVAAAMGPQLEKYIEEAVTRQMKSKDSHINATYFQSLANDLKLHEKDIMIYGFQTDGSPEIEPLIRQKIFKDKLELDIGPFKAIQVGNESGGKPKPIRVSFPTAEIRNSVCRKGHKLPREIKIDKCLPQRYRQPHREFREYGWQLKQAADVETRVVFKGHKLVLEFKETDKDDIKYDWTIAKEYYPQPVSPTDRTQVQRDRQGLRPSKTIEQLGTSKVILSNLAVNADRESTVEYFKNVFVKAEDKEKVLEVFSDKVVTKNVLIVALSTKKECADFKEKYEKLDFNGKKPRISVMLGVL